LSQSYGSILPTSLIYLVPSTRGCAPWRPAAVIGTALSRKGTAFYVALGQTGTPKLAASAWSASAAPDNLLPRKKPVKKKRYPFPAFLMPSPFLARRHAETQCGNINPLPFRRLSLVAHASPQDRLTRDQSLFTRNPAPLQSSKPSFEYLLLPPRSALGTVPRAFTDTLLHNPHALLLAFTQRRPSIGLSLERHPFSGLVHSAGELLHTPWRFPTSMATVLLSR